MNSKGFAKPKPGGARLLAYDLVSQVNRNGAYANLRLPELLSDSDLDLRDRSFVTELAYGTLRLQGKHDYAISKKADRPISELDEKIVDLLRLGIHQIFEMRVPIHAAVGERADVAWIVLVFPRFFACQFVDVDLFDHPRVPIQR